MSAVTDNTAELRLATDEPEPPILPEFTAVEPTAAHSGTDGHSHADRMRAIRTAGWESWSVEKSVNRLVEWALEFGATDVYFACQPDLVSVSARYLGRIVPVASLTPDYGTRCIIHIRHMGGLKLDGRRQPQDGRWTFRRIGSGRFADLRLNTIPTLCGETMALRLLSQRPELRTLDGLGFVGPQQEAAADVLDSHGGLILVVGPAGSGKTTSMYACLHRLNDGSRKIHTIEDPIEYAVPGLHQSQVNEVLGPSFEELLSAILRQSPDVIMVGEVRNAATAEIAVRAANAGNLVLATVHAPVASHAIQSMLSLKVTPRFLATSLRAVIACRLIRRLDPADRVAVDLSGAPETFAEVRRWLDDGQGRIVHAPCDGGGDLNSGYAGQTGVFEVLTVTPTLKRMVEELQTPRAIARQALAEGMLDFRRAALLKVARGETSFEELARVIPGDDELSDGY